MTPESTAAMTKIVNTLLRKPYSADFRKPLDFRSLGLDDYPQIIAKPMDLGTVKQKIERQGYMSVEQCADDIRLIWSNCKRYNGEGSDFYNLADRLSKQFEELFSKEFPKVKAKKKRGCPLAIDLTEEASPQEKKLRKSINDVAADLVCPITQELPIEPVMAEDGKIYEKKAILEWLSRDATSPVTRARMGSRLLPAIQTRNTIEALVKSGAIGDELTTAWKQKLAVREVSEGDAREGGRRRRERYVSARRVVQFWHERPHKRRCAGPRVVRALCGRPPPKRDGGFWRMSPAGHRRAPGQRARTRERDRGGISRFGRRRDETW